MGPEKSARPPDASEQPSLSREVPITSNWTTTTETIAAQTSPEEVEAINARLNNMEKLMIEPLPEGVLTSAAEIAARRVDLINRTGALGAPPRQRSFIEQYLSEKGNQEYLAGIVSELWGDESQEKIRLAQPLGQYLEHNLTVPEKLPALRAFGLLLLEAGRNRKTSWTALTEPEKQVTRLGEMTLLITEGARLAQTSMASQTDIDRFRTSAGAYAQSADLPDEYKKMLGKYLSQASPKTETPSTIVAKRSKPNKPKPKKTEENSGGLKDYLERRRQRKAQIKPEPATASTDPDVQPATTGEAEDSLFQTYQVDVGSPASSAIELESVISNVTASDPDSPAASVSTAEATAPEVDPLIEAPSVTPDPTPAEPAIRPLVETQPIWGGEKLRARDLVGIKQTLDDLRATPGQEFQLVKALLELRQAGIKTKEHIRAQDIDTLLGGVPRARRSGPLKYAQYLMYLQEYGASPELPESDREALLEHWWEIVEDAEGAREISLEQASQYAMYLKKLGLRDFTNDEDRDILVGNTEDWIKDEKPGTDGAFLARHLARLDYLGIDYKKAQHQETAEQLVNNSLRVLQTHGKRHEFARLMTTYQYLFGVKEIKPTVKREIVQALRQNREWLSDNQRLPRAEKNKWRLSLTELYRNLLVLTKTEKLKKQRDAMRAADEADLLSSRSEIDRRVNELLASSALDDTTARAA